MLTSPIHLAISAALRRVGKLMEFILFSQIRERGTGRTEIVAWSGCLASWTLHDSVPCEEKSAVSSFREAKAKIDRIAIESARNFERRGRNPNSTDAASSVRSGFAASPSKIGGACAAAWAHTFDGKAGRNRFASKCEGNASNKQVRRPGNQCGPRGLAPSRHGDFVFPGTGAEIAFRSARCMPPPSFLSGLTHESGSRNVTSAPEVSPRGDG